MESDGVIVFWLSLILLAIALVNSVPTTEIYGKVAISRFLSFLFIFIFVRTLLKKLNKTDDGEK